MGGFFFDFELFRTTSGPSRRVGETAVASMASSRDSAAATPSSRSHESLRRHQDAVDAMPHHRDAPRRSTATAASRRKWTISSYLI